MIYCSTLSGLPFPAITRRHPVTLDIYSLHTERRNPKLSLKMSTDYGKKTNADLVEILKSRSLAHTGKKADLVARLQEDDAKNAAAPAETKADTAAEDVIDWDDDVPAEAANAATEAGATAIAAGGKGAVANPVAVPNQKLDIDPATTDDLKVDSTGVTDAAQPGAAAEEVQEKPAVDYTRGLPATELEEELKKRKARAEKFGIVEDHETAVKEAEKQLSRAKRFGTGAEAEGGATVGVHGLDQALPDEKSRKRGPKDQGGRGGKRRDMGRNRNRNGRGDGRGDGVQKRTGGGNAASGRPKSNRNEKDNAAMEARKKRFAQAA